jgi:hypothetical protein
MRHCTPASAFGLARQGAGFDERLTNVWFLFLDESGRPDQDDLFALGGVAVRDRDWHLLRDKWQGVLREHAWPLDLELKWHGIRSGAVPPPLADDVFEMLTAAPFTAYVVLLDIEMGRRDFVELFATPEDIYATALMFLSERFQMLLRREDDLGVIVVDSRFREDDARLRRFFADLTKEGTPFMRLERIVEGLFLGPSQHSIGLQCADLVVSCVASAERRNAQARGYLRRLLARFATHPATGQLDGVGLKRFPEQAPRPPRASERLFEA